MVFSDSRKIKRTSPLWNRRNGGKYDRSGGLQRPSWTVASLLINFQIFGFSACQVSNNVILSVKPNDYRKGARQLVTVRTVSAR